jgi:hypothetical protein
MTLATMTVTPDGGWTTWRVTLAGDGAHVVHTVCVRRETGEEYTRTIKPGSENWSRAVRLAMRTARTFGLPR